MGSSLPRMNLLRSPWVDTFRQLVSIVKEDLLLVSPFVKSEPIDQVISILKRRGVQNSIRLSALTNLRPESALNGSMDLEAMVLLSECLPKFELTHLPSLHAKVYVADSQMAILTSGNLTEPGLNGNLEYGVAFGDEQVVTQVRRDFENYARLGARVSPTEITAFLNEVRELKVLFNRTQRTIRAQARRAFKEKLEATHTQLLRHRAKGRTTHAILSETVLFLLAKGPLPTVELHPLIQRLHPDICDDSIDRVIDGVHFGKRWKHYVRNAQQSLKREGRIRFDGERWHLVSPR
jgi:phosphatidylserine/phosphatidylglycerophosphate/cardiolipin synthase-like enzyme